MGKAILFVAISGATALVSVLWYAFGRGDAALMPAIASGLAIVIAMPILVRKDFQFVGIPGLFEIVFSLGALVTAILGGLRQNELLYWASILLQSLPCFRISLVSLKAYQRPLKLKLTVGIALAGLVGFNVYLGLKHGEWLGNKTTSLVKEWFPEATAPVAEKETPKPVKPKDPPPPVKVIDPMGPLAIVAGRALTPDMVEYQRHIDTLLEARSGRDDAVAALLQAYTTRAILEKKFQAFKPEDLRDERQWVMNRTRDSRLIHQIRTYKSEDLFLDVYVGANGLYKRKLQAIFDKIKQQEFKRRSVEVLQEVQKADGVERPGPKLEGVQKTECRYSLRQREFIGKFDAVDEGAVKAHPQDDMAPKLAKLPVNMTLPEISWGDMNALIIRRVQDDFKGRPVYETYRVVEEGLYPVWFKKQCLDMVIEIPDVELRKAMLEMAKDVNHIIKTK